ncbi:fibronectin type III domain-containing protein [Chitinophaga japonensis]|uniref:Fibronectin type-III domain-containing protein n=1 Tax=Chitinophaga japonensis TaxID=104662 RepID=A0A562SMB5_CHIJA|nr:hypothetical protein [Chitinophaga japonensis]TWI82455.1 hypothetical protein LX66_5028 [Chitinophaga japonensis]
MITLKPIKTVLQFIPCKYIILLAVGLLALSGAARAQRRDTARIQVMARAQEHSILLRWAVTKASAWRLSNQYGFELWRFTVVRNGQVLPQPEITLLSPQPIKPQPLEAWEEIVRKDNYAVIIAQAIFGKDFEVSGGDNNGIARLVNQSQELEQRFALSLYAADNSFEAAKLAGWGYEDRNVKPNEKYLYRIKSLAPATRIRIDSSGAFIGLADHRELPKPANIGAVFGDRNVVLSWDYSLLQHYYNSWFIERSRDNGQTYERARNLPVTNFNEKEKRASPRMYFIDSLQDNNTVYHYRVRGVSPFGEAGPPSDPVTGKGRHLLAYVPNIRSNSVDEKGVMELGWEFEAAGNKLISGFTLNQAPTADGPYTAVLSNIPPDQRTLRYGQLLPTNYFTITAVAIEGEPSTSFPVLVQPVDSIPPAAPAGLAGTIDSNGVVQLTWQANSEKDILGYKIFRSNMAGEEPAALVDSVWLPNKYRDSVNIRSLNGKVYYRVTALDQRYNQSPFSAVIEIRKPDVIPPTSPVLTGYRVADDAVHLSWIPARDEDIAQQVVFRKTLAAGADKWEGLPPLPPAARNFADRAVTPGQTYAYLVLARDSSGLESKPVQPLTVTVPYNPAKGMVRSFNAQVNRQERYIELFWKDDLADVQEYQLYKGEKDGAVTLWKIIPPGTRRIVDDQPRINTEYVYSIRAVLRSGATGNYKVINVQY